MNLTHKALWARCCNDVPLTITGLEQIIFTITNPQVSYRFWEDAMAEIKFGHRPHYVELLFCLFLAMEEKEIQEIVAHYKQQAWEARNRHHQVNP